MAAFASGPVLTDRLESVRNPRQRRFIDVRRECYVPFMRYYLPITSLLIFRQRWVAVLHLRSLADFVEAAKASVLPAKLLLS